MSSKSFQNFIDDLNQFIHASFEEMNDLSSTLFLFNHKEQLTVLNVNSLMENEDSKNALSWIPAYYGLLAGGVRYLALAAESYSTNTEALTKEYGEEAVKDKEFFTSLFTQYGSSLENFPKEFVKDIVLITFEIEHTIGEPSYSMQSILDVREEMNEDTLVRFCDKIESMPETSSSEGRFIDMLEKQRTLRNAIREQSPEKYEVITSSKRIDSRINELLRIASTQGPIHFYACQQAINIFRKME